MYFTSVYLIYDFTTVLPCRIVNLLLYDQYTAKLRNKFSICVFTRVKHGYLSVRQNRVMLLMWNIYYFPVVRGDSKILSIHFQTTTRKKIKTAHNSLLYWQALMYISEYTMWIRCILSYDSLHSVLRGMWTAQTFPDTQTPSCLKLSHPTSYAHAGLSF